MFLGFNNQKKLARYKRFSYEPKHFDAESENFRIRRNIIKKQLDLNQQPMSLEKEAFILTKPKPNGIPIILFISFITSSIGFFHFYSEVKTSIGKEVSVLGNTWGINELGQFTCLGILFTCGYMFIKKSKKL